MNKVMTKVAVIAAAVMVLTGAVCPTLSVEAAGQRRHQSSGEITTVVEDNKEEEKKEEEVPAPAPTPVDNNEEEEKKEEEVPSTPSNETSETAPEAPAVKKPAAKAPAKKSVETPVENTAVETSFEEAVSDPVDTGSPNAASIREAYKGFPMWTLLFLLPLLLLFVPRYVVKKETTNEDGERGVTKKYFYIFGSAVDYVMDEEESDAFDSIQINAEFFANIGREVDDDRDASLVYKNVDGLRFSVYATDNEIDEMRETLGYYDEQGVWVLPETADAEAEAA